MEPILYTARGCFRTGGRKKKQPSAQSAALQHPSVLMRTENFLVSFNLNLATNHRGNDVSKAGGDWTARRGRSGVLNLHSLECETHDSFPRSPIHQGRSRVGLLIRLTEKLQGLTLTKEYSRGSEERRPKWEPSTPAARQQSGYKVSTFELSVNVKTFCLGNMTPYAAGTTLFATINSDNDGH